MNHAIEPRSVLTTIKRFLGDPAPAGRRNRSRAGLIVSILIVPLLLGVMACFVLPVPIGNPEKSRIDPALSGAWIGQVDEGAWVLVFEPYDKRTWLVTWLFLEEASEGAAADGIAEDDAAPSVEKESDPEEAISTDSSDGEESVLDLLTDGQFVIENVSLYKGWLTRIKGERFMTWEPKMVLSSEDAMVPDFWWITRIRKLDDNYLTLDYINSEYFEDVETRSQAEKFIRRHIKDPELFMEEDDFPEIYARISQGDFDVLSDLLEEIQITSALN
jgi:hypothetical protein